MQLLCHAPRVTAIRFSFMTSLATAAAMVSSSLSIVSMTTGTASDDNTATPPVYVRAWTTMIERKPLLHARMALRDFYVMSCAPCFVPIIAQCSSLVRLNIGTPFPSWYVYHICMWYDRITLCIHKYNRTVIGNMMVCCHCSRMCHSPIAKSTVTMLTIPSLIPIPTVALAMARVVYHHRP